jgi:retron-type reverse transcriptase
MKTYKNLYLQIYNISNLMLAWRKARRHKTKKPDIIEFEKDTIGNLFKLQEELENGTYFPKPLENFIHYDPKTRKISKSDFRDRVIHHAIINIIELIFEKSFIYDSCANQIGKGNLFAIKRLEKFMRKVSRNGKTNGWLNTNQIRGYCLKADIKHYFEEVDHKILINILRRKITDEKVIWLIERILSSNAQSIKGGGRTIRLHYQKECRLGTSLVNSSPTFILTN